MGSLERAETIEKSLFFSAAELYSKNAMNKAVTRMLLSEKNNVVKKSKIWELSEIKSKSKRF